MSLGPADLKAFIDANGLDAQIVELAVPTPTVQAAAAAVGVTPDRIIKSLIFRVSSVPVLVIARGLVPVDRRNLAGYFQVGRKQVKLAGAQDVFELSGYPVGAVPPFAHRTPLRTLITADLVPDLLVYAGGGAENTLLRITVTQILRVTGAEAIDLA